MINLEKIEGNEIEKYLGPCFDAIELLPLKDDFVFTIFMNLNINPKFRNIESLLDTIDNSDFKERLKNEFNSVINRFSIFGFEVDERIIIFIVLTIDNWGRRNLLFAYILYIVYKNNMKGNKIDFLFFVEKCIAMGIPSDRWYDETWDKQKVKINIQGIIFSSDNLIDHIDAYKSLRK